MFIPLLARAERRGDRPVGVDHRTGEERPGLLFPDRKTHAVDRLHQRQHLGDRVEPAAEVAGRRRIGHPRRAQGVEIDLVVAKRLQVLQAVAAAQDVVGDVQHVIRLVVRQMDLEQTQFIVDRADQADLPRQQVDRADPADPGRAGPVGQVVADAPRGHDRPGRSAELPGAVAAFDAALASEPLFACTGIHSKRLLACKRADGRDNSLHTRKAGRFELFIARIQ